MQVQVEKEVVVVVAKCAVREISSDFTLKKYFKLSMGGLYRLINAITRIQALVAVAVAAVAAAVVVVTVECKCLIKVMRKTLQGPIPVPQGPGLGPCLAFYPLLNGFLAIPRKHHSKS